tara:strand:- start:383 stop:1132 length:750 start_codon:yes stop_codon:yes gene_type:complete
MLKSPHIKVQSKKDDDPFLDLRVSKNIMNYLWDIIENNKISDVDGNNILAGNISKSVYLQENGNFFYDNVLKDCAEYMYYRDWNNYYNEHIAKITPLAEFRLDDLWVNYQRQTEFNPCHQHGGMFSFALFMKIPTKWQEQHTLPIAANSNTPAASDFQFLLGRGSEVQPIPFPLSPDDEGRMLFFPAWLGHQVYPFYGTEEIRITVSGNLKHEERTEHQSIEWMEMRGEQMEKELRAWNEKTKQRKLNE